MSSPFGGLLFLKSPGTSGCSITVSLHHVVLTPTYDLNDSKRAINWHHRQHHAQGLWADIASRYMVFNLPSKSVLHMTSTQLDDALQFWDSVLLAHHDLRGTKPTHRERVVSDVKPRTGYMRKRIQSFYI